MKRQPTDPKHFELLRTFDEYVRARGSSIRDDASHKELIDELSNALRQHRDNPAMLHGFHVQSMFAHVAAALGHCDLITEEDSGLFFHDAEEMRQPDFRLHTRKGEQFFVEVKNHHKGDALAPHKVKAPYLRSLQRYARLLQTPLYFAIYWSRWNIWTLTRDDYFDRSDDGFQISMADAMKRNEMALLGDSSIGTVPPLSLRYHADPTRPRSIGGDGQIIFTIGRACIRAGDDEIVDATEQRIAWFLMLYGKWSNIDQVAQIENNELQYIDTKVSPEHGTDGQLFEILGDLSQMASKKYIELTSVSGRIDQLSPNSQPGNLAVVIPHDYEGDVLRLWRFIQVPNYKDVTAASAV